MRQTALKLIVCAIATLSTVSAYEEWELRGPEYQAKSAMEKHDLIWTKLATDQTSQAWKGAFGLAGFFAESMTPVL